MKRWKTALVGTVACAAMLASGSVTAAFAAEPTAKPAQTLSVDYGTKTGAFRGGSSGTLYGLGDEGAPTDAILDGARVQVTSQKPPEGLQHPSADVLAVDNQFFAHGGEEMVVNIQDYYPGWYYEGGNRPGDAKSYKLDVSPDDPTYGQVTNQSNGRWDFDEVIELVMNKILSTTNHPDQYVFMPFNEPDGGNWYGTDDVTSDKFQGFLNDWDQEYATIQRVWNQYKSGEKHTNGTKPTADHALIAGPGDSCYRAKRMETMLEHIAAKNTVFDVAVWHELGKYSLNFYRNNYNTYRAAEKKYGISPRAINISEYGELRDMSVPGQLIQWMSMFEDTKVQAQTAYWNYAGNLADNMARANAGNSGWWQFKWYGDLRGTETVKVAPPQLNTQDALQGIAAIDANNKRATVLYGGANDNNSDPVANTGANIPVTVHMTGLDKAVFGDNVDVEVRENSYTGPDGVAGAPRVVNVASNQNITNGTLDVTTTSADRYASYQLVVTPHQDRVLSVDSAQNGRAMLETEAEDTQLSGSAQVYTKTPKTAGFGDFMFSGNKDVGNFKEGSALTWKAEIPADGDYRLQVISANDGFPGTNEVSVDGKSSGTLQYGAELALKDAAKWKYRGSAELVLKGLTKGTHSITVNAGTYDNETDKLFLYQVNNGKDSASDLVTYPASEARLSNGAKLAYNGNGTNGFADLNGGSMETFAHAWEAGYHSVTATFNAPQGTKIAVAVNGQNIGTITAPVDGLQSAAITAALSEGINHVVLTGQAGTFVKAVEVSRASQNDAKGIKLEAEDLALTGGAKVVEDSSSDASGKKFVAGLGNQFKTNENGPAGWGDQTRVESTGDHRPTVITNNKGTLSIPAGKIPAGTYNVVVRFSNDGFIGFHGYNPPCVDMGLQIRKGDANGKELARGGFRYTFSDKSFLNRSIEVTTDGSALTLGNWDPAGTGKGAVSWGVAPNIDSLTFNPVTAAETTYTTDSNTLDAVSAQAEHSKLNLGSALLLKVNAKYAGGESQELTADKYEVAGFDANVAGKQTVTVTYAEGLVTRKATVEVTVVDPNAVVGVIVSGEHVTDGKLSLEEGNTVQLRADLQHDSAEDSPAALRSAVAPADSTDKQEEKTVTWSSSDESVAKVDAEGKVVALKAGKATISATSTANSAAVGSVELMVTAKAQPNVPNGSNGSNSSNSSNGSNVGQGTDASGSAAQGVLGNTGTAVATIFVAVVVLTAAGVTMVKIRRARR